MRFLNLTEISRCLGPSLCKALPGFHAFTGSDYTSAFFQKGKLKPFSYLSASDEFQNAFANLSEHRPGARTLEVLKKFLCKLYKGKAKDTNINKLRFQTFFRTFGPSTCSKKPFDKMKGLDPKSIPPSQSEILTHIARSAYVARMWANANKIEQELPTPNDGWCHIQKATGEVFYDVQWFKGPQMPGELIQHLPDEDQPLSDDEDIAVSSDDEEVYSEED